MNAITPRGIEINRAAARPIDAIRVARTLLRTTRVASLATIDPSGYPYATMTNLVVEADGVPAVFMAGLTLHARNALADPRVSITMADLGSDVMTTPRLTLSGEAERVQGEEVEPLKDRYRERFPKSKLYLSLPDSLLFRIRVRAVQLNGGPTQNANDVTPDDLLADLASAPDLMAAAPALAAALNERGAAEALARAAGARSGERWRVSAIDPEGIDLNAPGASARLWFGGRVEGPEALDAEVSRLMSLQPTPGAAGEP